MKSLTFTTFIASEKITMLVFAVPDNQQAGQPAGLYILTLIIIFIHSHFSCEQKKSVQTVTSQQPLLAFQHFKGKGSRPETVLLTVCTRRKFTCEVVCRIKTDTYIY